MRFEDFKDEILTLMGGSLIDVELCDKEIKVALRRAIRTFQQKGPDNYVRGFYRMGVERGKEIYSVPEEIHTITRVIRPTQWWNVEDPLALAAYNNLFGYQSVAVGQGDWLSLEFMNSQLEMWQRYMAFEVDLDHNKMNHSVRFLQHPKKNENWILETWHHLTEEQYMDVLWIQSWTLAECMIILGTAYAKFSGIPDPTGGTVNLGGDQLIQRAEEMKRGLLEDIENQVSADTDWYGIYIG